MLEAQEIHERASPSLTWEHSLLPSVRCNQKHKLINPTLLFLFLYILVFIESCKNFEH